MPEGTAGVGYMSGPIAGMVAVGALITTSGSSPNCHVLLSDHCTGDGASFGSPFGAPLSTHFAIIAICSSVSDGSGSYSPIVLSRCHGGIYRLPDLLFDRSSPGPRIFVGRHRKWRHLRRPVTNLTRLLEDGLDILGECRIRRN